MTWLKQAAREAQTNPPVKHCLPDRFVTWCGHRVDVEDYIIHNGLILHRSWAGAMEFASRHPWPKGYTAVRKTRVESKRLAGHWYWRVTLPPSNGWRRTS